MNCELIYSTCTRRRRRWIVEEKMKHRLFEMVNSEEQTNVGCKTHFPFKIWWWWCWWVFGLMSDSCSFTSNLCSAAIELSCWLIGLSGGWAADGNWEKCSTAFQLTIRQIIIIIYSRCVCVRIALARVHAMAEVYYFVCDLSITHFLCAHKWLV